MNFWYTTVRPPFPVALGLYIGIWIVCLGGLFIALRYSQKNKSARWTTRDILYTAIIGVTMMVYNSLIGDRFVGPLVQLIPVGGGILNFFDLKTWPYIFIFLVGVVVVRKPGIATALIFLKYVLEQLLFSSSGITPLPWPDYISQGVFVDLYLLARGEEVFTNPAIMIVARICAGCANNLRSIPVRAITFLCESYFNVVQHITFSKSVLIRSDPQTHYTIYQKTFCSNLTLLISMDLIFLPKASSKPAPKSMHSLPDWENLLLQGVMPIIHYNWQASIIP
jgi:hypothetical protein